MKIVEGVEQTTFELTPMERRAIEGIYAREREVRLLYVVPLQRELQQCLKEILDGIGLPDDSLNSGKYQLNVSTWTIERTPEPTNGEAQADHSI